MVVDDHEDWLDGWYGRGWQLTMVPGINTNRQNTNFYFVRAFYWQNSRWTWQGKYLEVSLMNAFRTCCHLHLDAGKLRGWHHNNNNYDDDICDDRLLDEFRNNVDDMMKMIDDICRPQRQYTGWLGRLMTGRRGRLASSKYVKMLIMMSSIIIMTMVMMMMFWWWWMCEQREGWTLSWQWQWWPDMAMTMVNGYVR